MQEIRPGELIGRRYRVIEEVGRGGMAIVYKVHHELLGSEHALKFLHLPGNAVQRRLEQEGRVQSGLLHENIVSVSDIVIVQGRTGLILEWVNGPSLDELLQAQPLTFSQVDVLVRGILKGVDEAHRRGIAHRDLKPANIVLQVCATAGSGTIGGSPGSPLTCP